MTVRMSEKLAGRGARLADSDATRRGRSPGKAAGRRPPGTAGWVLGVAVIEALPLARCGLRGIVEAAPDLHWLGYTADWRTAEAGLARLGPDVVLLDSTLDPHATMTARLTGADPNLTVVVLLDERHRTTGHVASARAARARGVLLRRREPGELLDGIRAAYTRGFLDPELAGLAESGRPSAGPVLSLRENQVLDLIAEGFSNEGISRELFVSTETVRTHVKHVLRKLEARDRAHAVARAYQLGLCSTSALPAPPTTAPARHA